MMLSVLKQKNINFTIFGHIYSIAFAFIFFTEIGLDLYENGYAVSDLHHYYRDRRRRVQRQKY